jgi:two-component system, NtrC family, sensor kinase
MVCAATRRSLLLSKWPIRDKLLTGLALLLCIVGALTWSGIHGLYAYRLLVKSLERRLHVLPLAAELSVDVNHLRVTLSEMHSTRDLRPFEAGQENLRPVRMWLAREEFRDQLLEVERGLEAYRQQLLEAAAIGTPIGDTRDEWQAVHQMEGCLANVAQANRDEDWVLDQVRVGQLSQELDLMQASAAALPKHLHKDVGRFLADIRGQYRTLIILAWTTSIFTAGLLALMVGLFYKCIFRPLRVLVKGSRKVAAGCFDYHITIEGHDEMRELADAMNDMTARFRTIRDDLDRQVQERTRQVVRSEQLASVGFLAAGVAHEINNPLASIALCSESLESRVADLLDDSNPDHAVIRTYLRMIQDEAFRCKGITERLLDFSRMGDVERQQADLRDLVQGVIDMVGHLGGYHDKHIEFLPGGPVVAPVNAQEMKQVVLNLLTNALDSIDPGGVVTVVLFEHDDQAELTIADNGCGMTPEVMAHLFEPFFTRKRGGQGTGLGLSITYRIVADHGGQILVSSDGPGRGAEFRVLLPLAAELPKEHHHRYQAA